MPRLLPGVGLVIVCTIAKFLNKSKVISEANLSLEFTLL